MAARYADIEPFPDLLFLNGQQLRSSDHALLDKIAEQGSPLAQEVIAFLREWWSDSPEINLTTSGSTGQPKKITVSRESMMASARLSLRTFGLKEGMKALLCLSPNFIAGKMMIVRAMVGKLELIATQTSADPLEGLSQRVDFAAMVPFQLSHTIAKKPETLDLISKLIIGGSAIDKQLVHSIQTLSTQIIHTYGMTETLSHIAIRQLNGEGASESFWPLEGIRIKTDSRNCLVAEVPFLKAKTIATNDLIELMPDGSFRVLGRADDVIITAGNKIHPLCVEEKLASFVNATIFIGSIPDSTAGALPVLVVEGRLDAGKLMQLWLQMEQVLEAREMPRYIFFTEEIPMLASGKVNRRQLNDWLVQKMNHEVLKPFAELH